MSAPVPVTAELLRTMPLPLPDHGGGKEERGRVLVIAGSVEVPGAALLAATAVLRAGAGKLQIATCRSIAPHLGLAVPEALVVGLPETVAGGISPEAADILLAHIERCDTVLIGPGMMDEDAVVALTAELLARTADTSFVLDAATLKGLSDRPELVKRHAGRVVVTPHSGEMAGLLGISKDEVEADPLSTARRAADLLGAVVAMKGAHTYIVDTTGGTWGYEGHFGLGTSGSGDTLAGLIAGLAARGAPPGHATVWGVYLHGEAGRRQTEARGPLGFLARELLPEIPALMASLAEPKA